MKNEHRFYVYILFRPDGSPCYIGKGQGRRWLQHESKGALERASNWRLAGIIRRCKVQLPKCKLRENLTHEEACVLEKAFISAIGRGRFGPLVNMTDGGEGSYGRKLSDDAKRRIGLGGTKRKGKKLGPCPEERRMAISAAKKGRHLPKMTGRGKGIPKSLAHREAISRALILRAKLRTPEEQAQFIEQIKRGWRTRRAGCSML